MTDILLKMLAKKAHDAALILQSQIEKTDGHTLPFEKCLAKTWEQRAIDALEAKNAEIERLRGLIEERQKEVDAIMETMPIEWRDRWCRAEICGCMGCVQSGSNCRITEREWLEWKARQR